MNNRLIIGPEAVNNLKDICDAYSASITKDFVNRSNSKNISFHPVFGFKGNIDVERVEKMKPWEASTFRGEDSESYLTVARDLMSIELVQKEIGFIAPKFEILDKNEYLAHQEELFLAIKLIHQISPWMGRLFDHVVYDIYFTKKNGIVRYLGGGGSTYRMLRLIFMSFRSHQHHREVEMAISLAHELGHNCFCLLQAGARPIVESSINKRVFSGVRKVKRSSYASFQALVALAYMLNFSWEYCLQCDGKTNPELKQFLVSKVTELYSDFEEGLNAFGEVNLTDLGKVIVFEFMELKNKVDMVYLKTV